MPTVELTIGEIDVLLAFLESSDWYGLDANDYVISEKLHKIIDEYEAN